MFTTCNLSTTSYISAKRGTKNLESPNRSAIPFTSVQENKHDININNYLDNTIAGISIAESLCSFFESIIDSLTYYNKSKTSKDSCDNIINNKEICNLTAKLSQNVYRSKSAEIDGWKPIRGRENALTGFKSVAYKKGNNIIISYCGTNDLKDVTSDTQMLMGVVPEQFKYANRFYKKICKENPNSNIILTGHSLGGSLAALVASTDEKSVAITYNAYGVEKIVKSDKGKAYNMRDNNNTYNYVIEGDVISNSSKHVGSTIVVKQDPKLKNKHVLANFINLWA